MQTGISTASLFLRKHTEEALQFLNELNVRASEVFLASFSEYTKEFTDVLVKAKGNINVHSVHTLTTQFEPQLYSVNDRAQRDSFILLDMAMQTANALKAKYYTFHGGARFKKTPMKLDFDRIGKVTQQIINVCSKYGVTLAYENVHWGYYNYVGFFSELKKRVQGLKGTLDIKQARQSGIEYKDFINEMNSDIVTVHLSDVTVDGKMCLPGRGITDFYDLFSRLKDVGFNGAMLIESYYNDYKDYNELLQSLEYLNELKEKIF